MILVTGANGTIGSELVSQLHARGAALRVFVRDARKLEKLPAGTSHALGDFDRPDTLRAALQGVTRVFLLSPGIDPEQFERTLSLLRAADVEQVVKLSTLEAGRETDATARWHRSEEQRIEASGLPWTFVRPGNFASNALHWAASIRGESAVYAATGAGKSAPIDPRDVAEVAALALSEPLPRHLGKVYELSGPALLDVSEQVEILARLLAKPLRFVDVEPASMGAQLLQYHVPAAMVEALVDLWHSIRRGESEAMTDTVPALLGRPARSFETWAREHLHLFK